MPLSVDLVGQKINRLTVRSKCFEKDSRGKVLWMCDCDCGNTAIVSTARLRSGHVGSCGCLKATLGGMSNTPEYYIWHAMKTRCHVEIAKNYSNYGGHGIAVCDRWKDSFEDFLSDMGQRPSERHSIERGDNNGHYEPNNCHWATRVEQANNTRRNVLYTHNGIIKSISQWASECGIPYATLYKRLIVLNWSFEKSISK